MNQVQYLNSAEIEQSLRVFFFFVGKFPVEEHVLRMQENFASIPARCCEKSTSGAAGGQVQQKTLPLGETIVEE